MITYQLFNLQICVSYAVLKFSANNYSEGLKTLTTYGKMIL